MNAGRRMSNPSSDPKKQWLPMDGIGDKLRRRHPLKE
jgi:hypothetical protein